jgi:ABC-2 type transport system ATP-binding protein
MAEVESLCDRVLILKDGLFIGNDTPSNLAKKIDATTLKLRLTKNAKLLPALLSTRNLKSAEIDGIIQIPIKERLLPLFLYELTKKNIQYSEISIDKPTLEDYFISVAKGGSREAL